MLKFAYDKNQKRIEIKDYQVSLHQGNIYCGQGHPLIAKRGEVVTHHYAHLPGYNCLCSEGKGDWHMWWQNRIQSPFLEFRIEKEVLKIADSVCIEEGKLKIIEFQSSVMSKEEISFREKFYTRRDLLASKGYPDVPSKLFWIFNLEGADLEIEHCLGDFICAKMSKGKKYFLQSSPGITFLDLGKRELVLFLAKSKEKSENPLIIGRVISLKNLDKILFGEILVDKEVLDEREYRQPLIPAGTENFCETDLPFINLNDEEEKKLKSILSMLEKLYF